MPAAAHAPVRLLAESLTFRYDAHGFGLCLPRLELRGGETLLLTGPSGSGKTTLLRLLAGLLPAQSGRLCHDGAQAGCLTPAALRAWRLRHTGLIFQDFALLDYLTAGENALVPARFLGLRGSAWDEARQRACELARALELEPHWNRRVSDLSQGERQRVAVARALAHGPAFLFADEPTAALDPQRRDAVMDLLESHTRQQQALLVLISHDAEVAARFPNRLLMEDLRA